MKHNFKDLSGQKFGRLTVVARAGLTTARCVLWHCLCDCGETSTVAGNDLRRGHTEQCKACGYAAQSRKAKDWTGEVVGSFTVVRLISRGRWEVTCHDCHDSFNRSGDWLRQAGVCPTCHARGRAAAIEADKQERTSQRTRVCTVCGDEFNYTHIEGEIDRRNCSRDCYEKRKRTVNAMRRRARNHKVSVVTSVDAYAVLDRDGWVCQYCGVEAPRHLRGTSDLLAPEVDHVIPLDMDGDHTDENCQCVHRKCNRAKREKIETGEAYDAILALPIPA